MLQVNKKNDQLGDIQKLINIFLTKKYFFSKDLKYIIF